MKQAVKFLSGSVVTYAIMAACSGGGGQKVTPGKSGEGAGGMASAVDATSAVGGGSSGGTDSTVGAPSGTEGTSTESTSVGSVGGNDTGDTGMMATLTGAMTDPVPDAQADPAESGSRLKARYMAGEDGSRSFVGWYDSERGENCVFYPMSDGRSRCVPDGFFNASSGTYYLDANCSQKLFLSVLACPATKYGYSSNTDGCATSPAYTLYELTQVTPSTMYVLSGEACTEVDAATTVRWYTGVAISPSDFVAGAEEVDS